MPLRPPAPTASIAHAVEGDKLFAPSAERNAAPILERLQHHAPTQGRTLEIASGTGQHSIAFARALPELDWHPTDIDPIRLRSIEAYRQDARLSNLQAPVALDATQAGWAKNHSGYDLVLNVNLLHLISAPEANTLLSEAAKALAPKGTLVLYGPFLIDGQTISEGDHAFHASLRAQDPETGYKDRATIISECIAQGLTNIAVEAMPANNHMLVFKRG